MLTLKGALYGIACAAFAFLSPAPSLAVIFYSTADPTYNTSPPGGALTGSGWQWVGIWGGYEGTPIGASYFLTAQHVGGTIGDPFVFQGVSYTSKAFYDDSASDLRIVQVSGTFPTWASIYRLGAEVGSPLVVIGEGLSRGTPVTVSSTLKGWQWGTGGGTMRWGQNIVYSVVDAGPPWGILLYALFQSGQGPNECDLANGDSSSPVFINDGTGWKLAGIAAAVDGPFNTASSGPGFNAAIFDASGLYSWDSSTDTWDLIPGPGPVWTGFYASRVYDRVAWIDSIVPYQPPVYDTPLFGAPATALLLIAIAGAGVWQLLRVQFALSTHEGSPPSC